MLDYSQYFEDLKKLVSFNSIERKDESGYPFGKEVNSALNCFLEIAERMGFETKNYDGYVGEVIFGGNDGKTSPKDEIGIIGHLDIVPSGSGWTTDPFTLTEKDGFLYGRGVLDDKGPLLLCLYALNELKKSEVNSARKFRLIVGCNEETGWKDVSYLQTVTSIPEYGFSPDGNFPTSYAEKGIGIFEFSIPKLKNFTINASGTAINAVCSYANCVAKDGFIDEKLLKKHNLSRNGNLIESVGVSAHGSAPELGKNALLPLFEYFLDMGEDVKNTLDCLFYDKFGLRNLKNEQGAVTISPDLISEKDGQIIISCDIRIPAPLVLKDVTETVDKFNILYKAVEKHPPIMVEKDGWFVNGLIGAYNSVTGENRTPVSMGGSTFARVFDKGCAFGPEFPNVNGHIHEADERVEKKFLLLSYEIYKTAIFNLATGNK